MSEFNTEIREWKVKAVLAPTAELFEEGNCEFALICPNTHLRYIYSAMSKTSWVQLWKELAAYLIYNRAISMYI